MQHTRGDLLPSSVVLSFVNLWFEGHHGVPRCRLNKGKSLGLSSTFTLQAAISKVLGMKRKCEPLLCLYFLLKQWHKTSHILYETSCFASCAYSDVPKAPIYNFVEQQIHCFSDSQTKHAHLVVSSRDFFLFVLCCE